MGNRAVITFSKGDNALYVFLDWNGDRTSIAAVLKVARELNVSELTGDALQMDVLADIRDALLGRSVYRETCGEADKVNEDDGFMWSIPSPWGSSVASFSIPTWRMRSTRASPGGDKCLVHAAGALRHSLVGIQGPTHRGWLVRGRAT